MSDKVKMKKVFTGTEILVNLLRNELEQIGVFGVVHNEFKSGVLAGFSGGLPTAIDLFIQASDRDKAEALIQDFVQRNKE